MTRILKEISLWTVGITGVFAGVTVVGLTLGLLFGTIKSAFLIGFRAWG